MGLYHINQSGTCFEEEDILPGYTCHDKVRPIAADKYWRYFACDFDSRKCGSDTRVLTMKDKIQKVTINDLDAGEACVYEIRYDESMENDDYHLWFNIQNNLNVTIADGLEKHPYKYTAGETMDFVPVKLDELNEKFEMGDIWWGKDYDGLAYLIVSSEVADAYGQFKFGKKEPVEGWVLYVIIGVSIFVMCICCSICFCFVRKMYDKKVKKGKTAYVDPADTRLEKYRYTPREVT